jgi:hypothetical protein
MSDRAAIVASVLHVDDVVGGGLTVFAGNIGEW